MRHTTSWPSVTARWGRCSTKSNGCGHWRRKSPAEVAGIADTGLLPDGDAVTVSVSLWADGWAQQTTTDHESVSGEI